jgi:gas vesicle protein
MKFEKEDVGALVELIQKNFEEDRGLIKSQYDDLREYIQEVKDRYAVSGDTLAKYAELLIKQTGQVLELVKIIKKDDGTSTDLTEEDFKHIKKRIEEEAKKK